MRNSLWGIAFQVLAVAIISGFFTYHYGNVYRGHIVMALGVFGFPIVFSLIFNANIKRMIMMFLALSVISFFVCGYVSIFLMGYYLDYGASLLNTLNSWIAAGITVTGAKTPT